MLNFNLLLFLLPTHNFQFLILFIYTSCCGTSLGTRVIQRWISTPSIISRMNSRKSFVELRHARAFTDRAQHWWKDETRTRVHFRLISFIQSSLSYHHFHLVFIFVACSNGPRSVSLCFALDFSVHGKVRFRLRRVHCGGGTKRMFHHRLWRSRHDAVYKKKELRNVHL